MVILNLKIMTTEINQKANNCLAVKIFVFLEAIILIGLVSTAIYYVL